MFSTPTTYTRGPASPFTLFNPSLRAQAASDLKTLCSSSSSSSSARKSSSASSSSSSSSSSSASSLVDVFGPIVGIKSKVKSTSLSTTPSAVATAVIETPDEPFITWPSTYTASKPSYRTPDYSPQTSPKLSLKSTSSSPSSSGAGAGAGAGSRRLRKQRSQAYYDFRMYACIGVHGFASDSDSNWEGERSVEKKSEVKEKGEEDEEFIQYPTDSVRSYLHQPSPTERCGRGRDSQITLINPSSSPVSTSSTLFTRRHGSSHSSRPVLLVNTFATPKYHNTSPALSQTTLVEEDEDGASSIGETFMTSPSVAMEIATSGLGLELDLEVEVERRGPGRKGDRWGGNWV